MSTNSGAVPEWIKQLSKELGEPKLSLEEVKKIFAGLKPPLSEEIISDRKGK